MINNLLLLLFGKSWGGSLTIGWVFNCIGAPKLDATLKPIQFDYSYVLIINLKIGRLTIANILPFELHTFYLPIIFAQEQLVLVSAECN